MSVEVEVKFLVDDLDEVRRRLLAAGAVAGAPRVYERNVLDRARHLASSPMLQVIECARRQCPSNGPVVKPKNAP